MRAALILVAGIASSPVWAQECLQAATDHDAGPATRVYDSGDVNGDGHADLLAGFTQLGRLGATSTAYVVVALGDGAGGFRLLEPDGSELTGPASWPRLCPCDAQRSPNRGCIRQPHAGSVRLRLPRLSGPSTLVIERRSASGWASLTTLEVDA